ncbi:MAG: hypothetical protein QW382_00015 [Nitrososphaerota archaeon]
MSRRVVMSFLKMLVFFLTRYKITILEIVKTDMKIMVLRYGAGFRRAWPGGVEGSGSWKGVMGGCPGLISTYIIILANSHVKKIVESIGI